MTKISNYQRTFFWNMMGSLSSAVISVVLLIVVTRFLPSLDSDRYVFAYSLANLLVVIGLFQVRNFQATDIGEKYSFTEYFFSRIVSCALMIIAVIIYLVLSHYDSDKVQVIFYVTLYRLSDAISDLFQGLFQQHERLDIAGKSLTFRNSIIFLIFALTVTFSKDLLLGLKLLCLSSYLFIVLYDFGYSLTFETIKISNLLKKNTVMNAFQLMRESLPLFINGFLIIYIYNQAKYSLETMTNIGKIAQGSQTIFNILFMPAFVMNLMMLFFRPVITEMAIAITKKHNKVLITLQKRLFINLFILSLLILLVSFVLGIPFLNLLYGVELENYHISFMLIMLAGSIGSFATAIDNIMTAMRQQKLLLFPYFGAFIFSLLVTNYLVTQLQIFGASLSFVLTMLVWLILSLVTFQLVKRRNNAII